MTAIITASDKLACAEREVACPHCQGSGRLRIKAFDRERILARFDPKWLPDDETGCWVWVAAVNPNGYGIMIFGSRLNGTHRPRLAHRIAYELYVGPIPDGLVLDHLCRNRFCVNPDHLEPVTMRENTLRGMAPTANMNKTHCPQGHPYSGKNLYSRPDGSRGCNACRAEAQRRWKQRACEQRTG